LDPFVYFLIVKFLHLLEGVMIIQKGYIRKMIFGNVFEPYHALASLLVYFPCLAPNFGYEPEVRVTT